MFSDHGRLSVAPSTSACVVRGLPWREPGGPMHLCTAALVAREGRPPNGMVGARCPGELISDSLAFKCAALLLAALGA